MIRIISFSFLEDIFEVKIGGRRKLFGHQIDDKMVG